MKPSQFKVYFARLTPQERKETLDRMKSRTRYDGTPFREKWNEEQEAAFNHLLEWCEREIEDDE